MNDTDPDGDNLTILAITSQPSSGLAYIFNNKIIFDPLGDFSGNSEENVNFTYRITDGKGFYDEAQIRLVVQISPLPDIEGLLINGIQVAKPSSYGYDQDFGGAEVSADGSTLHLTNNAWKKVAIDTTITADTVLTFDFKSDVRGEIHGIGFDTDDTVSPEWMFKLDGTQWGWGLQAVNGEYITGSGYQSYSIRVGDYFQGDFDRIVFAMDDDAGVGADSSFRNISLSESPRLLIGTQSADVAGYSVQDAGSAQVSEDGSSVTLTENAWKKIAINTTITADTAWSQD